MQRRDDDEEIYPFANLQAGEEWPGSDGDVRIASTVSFPC